MNFVLTLVNSEFMGVRTAATRNLLRCNQISGSDRDTRSPSIETSSNQCMVDSALPPYNFIVSFVQKVFTVRCLFKLPTLRHIIRGETICKRDAQMEHQYKELLADADH